MPDIVIQVDRGTRWLRLQQPVRVIDVRDGADLDPALREIEQLAHTRRLRHLRGGTRVRAPHV
jgi:hypothetical protein